MDLRYPRKSYEVGEKEIYSKRGHLFSLSIYGKVGNIIFFPTNEKVLITRFLSDRLIEEIILNMNLTSTIFHIYRRV